MVRTHSLIVVVDDNTAINRLLCELLVDEGYRVISCASGADGYCTTLRARPDLVITDLQMETQEAGLELLDRLRRHQEFQRLAVILCSADRQALQMRRKELAMLGAHTLVKPFELDRLLLVVRQLLPDRMG